MLHLRSALLAVSLAACSSNPSLWPYARPESIYAEAPAQGPDDLYNVYLGRHCVDSMVVLESGHAALANELGELFTSNDSGATWQARPGPRIRGLHLANGSELWAASGWWSHHGSVGGYVRVSRDAGQHWRTFDLAPGATSPPRLSRLPRFFIGESAQRPLLLTADGSAWRADAAASHNTWTRAFVAPAVPTHRGVLVGESTADSIYLAYANAIIAETTDFGQTWTWQSLRPLLPDILNPSAKALRCGVSHCYALVSDGQDSAHVLQLARDMKNWTLLLSFDRRALGSAAVRAAIVPTKVDKVFVCAVLPLDGALLFSATASSTASPDEGWALSFSVPTAGLADNAALDGTVLARGFASFDMSGGGTGREEACNFLAAPQGRIWAFGKGAFELVDGAWVRRWHYPDRFPRQHPKPR